jgi:hypothetical protein
MPNTVQYSIEAIVQSSNVGYHIIGYCLALQQQNFDILQAV